MRPILPMLVLASALAGMGCRAGFKSTAGGAVSPTGLGKGATHSLVFSDEGGILTRVALGALGVVAAAGAVHDVHQKTEINTVGDTTVKTTITTGTLDQKALDDATKIGDLAGDTNTRLGTENGSLGANLEIAATTLGGDTSGGEFDFGYGYHRVQRLAGEIGVGFRTYAGFGYGHFTFHDRLLMDGDRGPPHFGDGTFTFLGIPTRLGFFIANLSGGIPKMVGTETFGKVNLNFDGKTVASAGQRLQLSYGYAEVSVCATRGEDSPSYALEIGGGF